MQTAYGDFICLFFICILIARWNSHKNNHPRLCPPAHESRAGPPDHYSVVGQVPQRWIHAPFMSFYIFFGTHLQKCLNRKQSTIISFLLTISTQVIGFIIRSILTSDLQCSFAAYGSANIS